MHDYTKSTENAHCLECFASSQFENLESNEDAYPRFKP